MLLRGCPRLRDPLCRPARRVRRNLPRRRGLRAAGRRLPRGARRRPARRRRRARSTATRSPTRRSSAPELAARGLPHPDPVRPPHPRAALRHRTTTPYAGPAQGAARLSCDAHLAEPSTTAWPPTPTGARASRPRRRSTSNATSGCPAATSSTAIWPGRSSRRGPRHPGRWGVATGHARPALRGRRRARWRGQRDRRPQRRHGGARGRVTAETITRKLLLPRPHRR